MIEINVEFPQRDIIQATAEVNEQKTFTSEITINAKPEITGVTASVDNNTGTPYVDVTPTGTGTEYSFNLAFHNLKGDKGEQGETGEQGPQGIQGETGPQGATGPQGVQGDAATIELGTVTTGEAGTDVIITNTGTSSEAVFNFTIPRGLQGEQGAKGDTGATGPQGEQGIQGIQGEQGPQGIQGEQGETGADGYSPTATVTKTGDVATITITDINGTTTTNIYDGAGAVSDVQVNGVSVLVDSVANITGLQPLLTSDNAGDNIEIVSGNSQRSLLPEGYTQYDYISVNGDCYYITDYYPNTNTEVKTKTFLHKQPTSPLVTRWTTSPTNDTFGFYMGKVSGRLTFFYGRYSDTKYLNIENVKLNIEHDIYMGVDSITFDDTSYSITRDTFTSIQPIYIGAFNQTGSTLAGMMYGRIYPVQFIEGGKTVKHYIPCKNDNGVIGLYEAITGTFINPTGNGTAKKGRPTINLDTIPDTYTRIDFLQATGTQYIDSGVVANFANNKIEQTATVEYTTNNTTRELMGTNGYGFWGKNASNKIEAALGQVTVTDNALTKNVISWTTDPDGNALTLNVNSNQYTSTASSFVDANYAYYVFALGIRVGSGASASFLCHAKVWDYTIAVDNEVVCYLIPVKRNSDDVLGMYDVVTGTFETNAGTGTFIAGSVVANTTLIKFVNNSGFITSSDVGNGTITINQGGTQKGTFTLNQSGDATINLDAGGGTEEVFIADYGTTQIDDITDALSAGKMVYCRYTNNDSILQAVYFQLVKAYFDILGQTVEFEFSYTLDDKIYSTKISSTINTNNGWATITYNTIPTAISDLTDDTATNPIDKADTLTGLTATVSELNVLDGITASTTELNYTDGVTSNIQTQLDGKANTDLSNLTSTASANFDGEWISGTYNIISSSTTLNADADKSYSLSSYLPDDNYVYEVYFSIVGTTGASSGNYVDIAIYSAFLPSTNRVAKAQTRTSSSVMWAGNGTAPIGADRTIGVRNFGNKCTVNQFRVYAYRRIGTNQ